MHPASPWLQPACSCRSAFAAGRWSSSSPVPRRRSEPPCRLPGLGERTGGSPSTPASPEPGPRTPCGEEKTWPRSIAACTGQHTGWARVTAFDSGCDPSPVRWRRRASSTVNLGIDFHGTPDGEVIIRSVRLRTDVHPAGVPAGISPGPRADGRPGARRGAEVPTADHRRRRQLQGLPGGRALCVTPVLPRGGRCGRSWWAAAGRGGRGSRVAGKLRRDDPGSGPASLAALPLRDAHGDDAEPGPAIRRAHDRAGVPAHADQADRGGPGPRQRRRHRRHHHAVRWQRSPHGRAAAGDRHPAGPGVRGTRPRGSREHRPPANLVSAHAASLRDQRTPGTAAAAHPEDDRFRQVPALWPVCLGVPTAPSGTAAGSWTRRSKKAHGWSAGLGSERSSSAMGVPSVCARASACAGSSTPPIS